MKRTYQPNKKKRAKKHGFFARLKGKVLNSRRAKKRNFQCCSNLKRKRTNCNKNEIWFRKFHKNNIRGYR